MENYIIYPNGKIFSIKRKIFLKPLILKSGYCLINLSKKQFYIHRLIAEKFIPNPNNLPQVNHIDGNKQNNSVENLEWCNQRYNSNHYHNQKYPGVYKTISGTFASKYQLNGKQIHIGTYITPEEAYESYKKCVENVEK